MHFTATVILNFIEVDVNYHKSCGCIKVDTVMETNTGVYYNVGSLLPNIYKELIEKIIEATKTNC